MFDALQNIRPPERRATWGAFATLMGFMTAHSLLETARDALFLSKIPATRLPWMYLAIAAVALLATRLQQGSGRTLRSGPIAVSSWLAMAAVITVGFWAVLRSGAEWGLYALYVWSGVLATLVVVQFWTLLGDRFTVSQAKRLYAFVGAGSVVGAIAGTGLARLTLELVPARDLLLIAGAVLAATAAVPALTLRGDTADAEKRAPGESGNGFLGGLRTLGKNPYALRVAVLVIVSTMTLTIADYIFKSTVADAVAPEDLGAFFATAYLALNLLSLAVQLFVVQWAVRKLRISLTLAILPVLLLGGAIGFVLGGALLAALVIKGADGSLRHSLHRTSTELLFVPMSEQLRTRTKAFIDVAGQRGGQALASVGILAALALVGETKVLAVALILLLGAWTRLVVRLEPYYLNVFRETLSRHLTDVRQEYPDLDLASLETLVSTLNSDDDKQVIAAMRILREEGKAKLVPALILYHPSAEVVREALELFVTSNRTDFVPIVDRHLMQIEASLRPAFIRARTVVAPDEQFLRDRLETSCKVCRATATIHLVARGWLAESEVRDFLDQIIDEGPDVARQALAESVGYVDVPGLDAQLLRLADCRSTEVRREVVAAIGRLRKPEHLQILVCMMEERDIRVEVRAALRAFGVEGMEYLSRAMDDPSLPQTVRWQLPRAVCEFATPEAATILLDHFPDEVDSLVRYRIVRELEQLREGRGELALDTTVLRQAIRHIIGRASAFLDWRLVLEGGANENRLLATPVHQIMVRLMLEKERRAIRSLVRILGLYHPRHDFVQIQRGLDSDAREARASSRELLEYLVEPQFRRAVLGLLDDGRDAQRLGETSEHYTRVEVDYGGILQLLIDGPSDSLRGLAVHHVGELGWGQFLPRLQELKTPRTDVLWSVVERLKEQLAATTSEGMA